MHQCFIFLKSSKAGKVWEKIFIISNSPYRVTSLKCVHRAKESVFVLRRNVFILFVQ